VSENRVNDTEQFGYRCLILWDVSARGKSYGYDACGNIIERGDDELAYDEQNRLVSSED